MPIHSRPFSGYSDAPVLADIVMAATAIDPRCGYRHVGDVWWGLYQNTVFDPPDNIRLWIDDGTPVGFAWFDSCGVSVQGCPGYVDADALEDEMLSWAEQCRRALPAGSDGASMLTATAFEHDARRSALLVRRGYARTGTPMYHFHRSLSEPIPAVTPPPGITVRHVGGEDEWAERVATHREVWHPSRVTLEAYQRLRATPGYTPALDLVAAMPDGTFASYCICWLDPVNQTGE